MTEPRYYGSTASLRELLESDAIDPLAKSNIRIELLHRESVCLPIKPEHVETMRQSLTLAYQGLSHTRLDLQTHDMLDEDGRARFAAARTHVKELIDVIDSYLGERSPDRG